MTATADMHTTPTTGGDPGGGVPPSDLNVILPTEGHVTIADVDCRVKRIRTRELMLLVRVLTAGVGSSLGHINFDADEQEWSTQIAALLVMAIPEANDEFIDLLAAIVEPDDTLTDEQRRNLDRELGNPEIDTAMDVVHLLVEQEKDTIPALLGKARLLIGQVTALYKTGTKGS